MTQGIQAHPSLKALPFSYSNRTTGSCIQAILDLAKRLKILFRFRIWCHAVQAHPVCANIILVCILVSSAFLACEDPLRAQSDINVVSAV